MLPLPLQLQSSIMGRALKRARGQDESNNTSTIPSIPDIVDVADIGNLFSTLLLLTMVGDGEVWRAMKICGDVDYLYIYIFGDDAYVDKGCGDEACGD